MVARGGNRTFRAALALLSAALLAACGGGTITAGGGSGGTGVGPVTGFGSVIVNGVRYSTDNANIVIGGSENRPESELKVGMRVRVDGAFSTIDNTGTATKVVAIREVLGPLDDDGVDNVLHRFSVAGQTVLVDPATLFDNVADLLELQAIQSGALLHPEVEVHGAADESGAIHATYVRKGVDDFPVASDNVEVRGIISGLAPDLTRFFINALPVNYNGAVRVNVPLTGLADGMYVEVKGKLTAAGGSGTLNASRVEALDNTLGANNDRVRVEGYVVSGTSKNSFVLRGPGGEVTVNGIGATVSPPTGTIGPGQKVQVEGDISGKVIRASAIRVYGASSVKIEATMLAGPNVAAGTFVLLTKTVRTDGYTRFKDSAGGVRSFGLSSLSANDNVRVVGSFDNAALQVRAVLVERISSLDQDLPLLQGPVIFEVPNVRLVILGIDVLAGYTNTEYFSKDGTSLGEGAAAVASFFAELNTGDVVKVQRGIFTVGDVPSISEGPDGTPNMEVEFEEVNN